MVKSEFNVLPFDERQALQRLKKYLPSQAPLKDFVHHNTLHAFQNLSFEEALRYSSRIFGYKTSFTVEEYRQLYREHRVREDILERVIIERKGTANADLWIYKVLNEPYELSIKARVGSLRRKWKRLYNRVDLHAEVEVLLFKLLSDYLDQGIAQRKISINPDGFLATLRGLEKNGLLSVLRSVRGRQLLMKDVLSIQQLLKILLGDELLFERYLFDQQFSHPGWSGIVSYIESHPDSIMTPRSIGLEDMIKFELILEIDALEHAYGGGKWKPMCELTKVYPLGLFEPVALTEMHEVLNIWQEAYEWSYYDQVVTGIVKKQHTPTQKDKVSFQALFCIDDREGSIRRHIESIDKNSETFGTPGHFGLAFFYKPKQGTFRTRVCPGSITPVHVVKEVGKKERIPRDIHFSSITNHPLIGYPVSLVLGFFSGYRLFMNIFKPSKSPSAASSFGHMSGLSELTIFSDSPAIFKDGLQVGFTIEESALLVEQVLKSIGLIENFADIVYVIGHGASSINNTHYPGYDCGACSGRPGSVNARVFCSILNNPEVRKQLVSKGISIPARTQFLAGLHDTTRDEFEFYDESAMSPENQLNHIANNEIFNRALSLNAKERSRRFFSIDSKQSAEQIHELVKNRSVSLFEPRPELNHATNAMCIIGRHALHEGLFLDRRAFSNSYDYRQDPDGSLLENILNAATPVCGGINLEYYFSRLDNEKFGAGSKLPHNVVSLIGVANGMEGDLRTGLPIQMIEAHDPIRLLMIVEQHPDIVLKAISQNSSTYKWFINEWVNLIVIEPETHAVYRFRNKRFETYVPLKKLMDTVVNVNELIESSRENLPVYLVKS